MLRQVITEVTLISAKLGLVTPAMRAVAAMGITAAVMFYAKPAFFFDENGEPKVWSALVADDVALSTTPVTYWMVILGIGTSVILFM